MVVAVAATDALPATACTAAVSDAAVSFGSLDFVRDACCAEAGGKGPAGAWAEAGAGTSASGTASAGRGRPAASPATAVSAATAVSSAGAVSSSRTRVFCFASAERGRSETSPGIADLAGAAVSVAPAVAVEREEAGDVVDISDATGSAISAILAVSVSSASDFFVWGAIGPVGIPGAVAVRMRASGSGVRASSIASTGRSAVRLSVSRWGIICRVDSGAASLPDRSDASCAVPASLPPRSSARAKASSATPETSPRSFRPAGAPTFGKEKSDSITKAIIGYHTQSLR